MTFSLQAQKKTLEFVKNSPVEKGKTIVIQKDKMDRYDYYQDISRAFMAAGYNVVSGDLANPQDKQSSYFIEYHVGPIPKTGPDDFGFAISLSDGVSGKIIATGHCNGGKSFMITNMDDLIKTFIERLAR